MEEPVHPREQSVQRVIVVEVAGHELNPERSQRSRLLRRADEGGHVVPVRPQLVGEFPAQEAGATSQGVAH